MGLSHGEGLSRKHSQRCYIPEEAVFINFRHKDAYMLLPCGQFSQRRLSVDKVNFRI